jgi:hypothetical protein
VLQAILDPAAPRVVGDLMVTQVLKESKGTRGNEAIQASKVRKEFQACQAFQVPLSSYQDYLGRMGATVRQDLQGLRDRMVKRHSLGPRGVRGRPAQKATPGLQL